MANQPLTRDVPAGPSPLRRSGAAFRVGAWQVDPQLNELRRGEERVRLEPRAVEVLAYLADRLGQVVPREELLGAVWPGVVVGDDALTQAVIKLRKALGDDAHEPKYIETVSKRGYRLIACVEGDKLAAAIPDVLPARGATSSRHARVAIAACALVAVV